MRATGPGWAEKSTAQQRSLGTTWGHGADCNRMLSGGEAPKGWWALHLHPLPSVISRVVYYRNHIIGGYMKKKNKKEQSIDYKCLDRKCGRKKYSKRNDHGNN